MDKQLTITLPRDEGIDMILPYMENGVEYRPVFVKLNGRLVIELREAKRD